MSKNELRAQVHRYREEAHGYLIEMEILTPQVRSNRTLITKLLDTTRKWYEVSAKYVELLKKLYPAEEPIQF